MEKVNIGLYQACIAKKKRMFEIADLANISNSRFSKILNGKFVARLDERRILSKILGKTQKELFGE